MLTFARFMDCWSNAVVLGLLAVTGILPAAYLNGCGADLVKMVKIESR